MKHTALATLVALSLAAPASAEEAPSICDAMYKIASNAMTARQNDMRMSEAFKMYDAAAFEPFQDVISATINAAYEKRVYSSDSYKEKAVAQFANEVEITCLKASKNASK